jgi:aspartyl-tRNA(Asn)/glutamyl-tRNA(Gln) amidotransferase subunit A
MNGLLGMKATYGRVSRRGVMPLSFSLDHVGPLTRTVKDNALALSIISGFDRKDPGSADVSVPSFSKYLGAGIKGLKIGVIRHFYQNDMVASDEMTSGIETAFDVLANNGAELTEIKTRSLIDFATCNRIILLSEACAIHQKWLVERTDDYGESLLKRLLPGTAFNAVDYVQAVRTRARYAAEFNKFFEKFDAIVTVNNMEVAFPIEDPVACEKYYSRQARTPFNVTGNPALAVPVGFSAAGLPLSMQVVTSQFDEAMAYRIAAFYERSSDWTNTHPDLEKTARLPVD